MSTTKLVHVVLAVAAVAGCARAGDEVIRPIRPAADDVVMGNARCADVATRVGRDLGDFELAVEPGSPGAYQLDEVNRVVLASEDLQYLDWSATIGVDAVLVRGGGAAAVYVYDPEAKGGAGLSAPTNPRTGEPYRITAVDVCYDHELLVAASAETALTRTHVWTVGVTAARAALSIEAGQVRSLRFVTRVAPDGWVDGNWAVAGEIVIDNPAPYPAQVVAIGDRIGELPVAVDCPRSPPFTVAPFGRVVCRYGRALPDESLRFDRIVVDTVGYEVGAGHAMTAIDLADAKVAERDLRVEVWDDHAGRLGETSAARSYAYDLRLGPYETCGERLPFTTTATLLGYDNGRIARASTTIDVTVTCRK